MVFFQSFSTAGGNASVTGTMLALFSGYCGADVERIIDPKQSGPVGGGKIKSDIGHRKYVLVEGMTGELDPNPDKMLSQVSREMIEGAEVVSRVARFLLARPGV